MSDALNLVHIDVAAFGNLFDGAFTRVVYGLIDPRRPEEMAYVGKTEGHVVCRYFHHLQDGLASYPSTKRCGWLTELRKLGLTPGLCVIESVGADGYALLMRERFWIRHYRTKGQAWINHGGEPAVCR